MLHSVTHGFTGKVWGNGQFGLVRSKTLSVGVAPPSVDAVPNSRWLRAVAVHGVQATLDFIHSGDEYYQRERGMLPVPSGQDDTGKRVTSIGLSMHSKPHRRGGKGITTHGTKVVKNAARALQERYGRSRLSFVTLTVPGMTTDNLSCITEDWARIVKVFVQKLKRALVAAGLSGEVVGVTEIQEERLEKRGELALHLHLLFQGAAKSWDWAYPPKFYREMWFSVLEVVVPRSEWSSEAGSEKVHSIRFSAEGYLGKYMSKGAKNLVVVKEKFPDVSLPAAWWMCTYKLRRHVLSEVCHVSGDSGAYLLELIETCPDLFDYLKPVYVRVGERDIGVGYCGKIGGDRLKEIRSALYALKEGRLVSLGVVGA